MAEDEMEDVDDQWLYGDHPEVAVSEEKEPEEPPVPSPEDIPTDPSDLPPTEPPSKVNCVESCVGSDLTLLFRN